LKQDRFVAEVGHTVEYVSSHKDQVVKYAIAGLVVVLLAAGAYWYRGQAAKERQTALAAALRIREGIVAPMANPGDTRLAFPSMAEKNAAFRKSLVDIVTKYSGSNESSIALYHLGVLAADENKMDEAEKHFQQAAKEGNEQFSSAARWALAQIYIGSGREKLAEEIYRGFIARPTAFVSKEQAELELAKLIAPAKPDEARKLVEPLAQSPRSAVARYANSILSELPSAPPTPPTPAGKK
jgi:tetratricopeptide (TPR) repeat protein